jgi:hypothetical protein
VCSFASPRRTTNTKTQFSHERSAFTPRNPLILVEHLIAHNLRWSAGSETLGKGPKEAFYVVKRFQHLSTAFPFVFNVILLHIQKDLAFKTPSTLCTMLISLKCEQNYGRRARVARERCPSFGPRIRPRSASPSELHRPL